MPMALFVCVINDEAAAPVFHFFWRHSCCESRCSIRNRSSIRSPSLLVRGPPELTTMKIMSDSDAAAVIWKEIEVSESYLGCSMCEEVASSASLTNATGIATQDMLESAAMVLVQLFKQLGRTPEILNQLRLYFISVKAIPAQVLLIGKKNIELQVDAMDQISNLPSTNNHTS